MVYKSQKVNLNNIVPPIVDIAKQTTKYVCLGKTAPLEPATNLATKPNAGDHVSCYACFMLCMYPYLLSELIIGEEMAIRRKNLVATLAFIDKEYTISFDMNVKLDNGAMQQGVLHFITGDEEAYGFKYGDTLPGIWVLNKRLIIDFGARHLNRIRSFKTGIEYFSLKELEDQKWINIEISQSFEGGKVWRDHSKRWTSENLSRTKY